MINENRNSFFINTKIIVALIIYILILTFVNNFVFTFIRVSGDSMENTLSNGNIIFVNITENNFYKNDIVVSSVNNRRTIKRIIGVPYDLIKIAECCIVVNDKKLLCFKNNVSYFNNCVVIKEIKLNENEFFIIGDNYARSFDSRDHGAINRSDILGIVSFRIFPYKSFR